MENQDLINYMQKVNKLVFLLNDKIAKELDLSPLECKLLNQIYLNNFRCYASKLAKFNNVTIAAIMHCLVDLENRNYLIKSIDETDNRFKVYTLTEKGIKNGKIINDFLINKINGYLNYLADDKIYLGRILEKTIDFLEENKNV